MDSKPLVSLSTARATQSPAQADPQSRTLSSSSSTGSLLIRAPPSLDDDDDDDCDFESNGHKIDLNSTSNSDSCGSEFESEGFVSGEDFETASERPLVADPDEDFLDESGVVEKFVLSRPYVADPDAESLENFMEEEEEVSGFVDELTAVDNSNLNRVMLMPIARLSMDDDGFDELLSDEGMVSEVDDNGFSGIGVLKDIDGAGAPRVKVLGFEGEDELLVCRDSSVVSQPEEDAIVEKGYVNHLVSLGLDENKGPGVAQEAQMESFVGMKEDVLGGNLKLDEVAENSLEERPSLENLEQERINGRSGHEVKEQSATMGNGSGHAFEPVINPVGETVVPNLKEIKVEKAKMELEESNNESSSVDASESVGTMAETDLGVELCDSVAAIRVESVHSATEGNEIHIADSLECLEPNPPRETIYLGHGDLTETIEGAKLEITSDSDSDSLEFFIPTFKVGHMVKPEAQDVANHHSDKIEGKKQKGLLSDEDIEDLIFGSSGTYREVMNDLAQRSASSSLSGAESSQDHSQTIDRRIVMGSDEEVDTDRDGEGKELFDPAALAALLKAATSGESDSSSITSTANGSRMFSLKHPTGSDSSFRSLRPAPPLNVVEDESKDKLSEEERKKVEKIQLIRVKFLRLVQRLGHSPDDSIVAQVLYRLALAARRHSSQAFSLESAKTLAMQLEADSKDDLDFSLNILVLGKTGVGKSATINSIFGEAKATSNAFEPGTTNVKEIVGKIDGVNIRILDTPGLRSPVTEQAINQKILASIKKLTKKFAPDVILYVDRLDMHTRDLTDLPLLKSLTSSLSSSIWQSAIITLTHAASAPPDGPSGSPISYEAFVAQRSHIVQQSISQAVGDLRLMNPSMMHPVSLVENHPSCQKNNYGEIVLPDGQSWRPQLLLLCYSLKILSEANSISKPQDPFNPQKLFGFRLRSPPLPHFLSSLLQSHAHPKLSIEQGGDDVDSDIELGDSSESDQEEEDEYDQLPPFKPLRRSQVARLSKEQRKAYFEEYDYRVKLLQKKQWREEAKKLREIKKKGQNGRNDYDYMGEDGDQEDVSPANVPVPLPDMVLPPSFDGDSPTYKYRFLEPTSQLLVRPVLEAQGWDHDSGYDGVSIERNLTIGDRFPGAFAVQITKDKKDFNIHLVSSVSAKHGENGSTMAGFDIQTIGTQLAYILRGETKFKNFKINKTTAGFSITFLGENVATGLKIEDQIALGKRLVLVGSAGAVRSQGDTAYGANLEVCLKDKDFPIVQDQSSLGLSLMKWRGDLGLTANLQWQFSIGRSSKVAVGLGLNNKRSGQITLKTTSSEQLQMALIGILPIAISIFRNLCPGSAMKNSVY